MIKFLCWLKVKLIALKLQSQSFIHMEISHGEFIAIFRPKDKYEKLKESS